MTFMNTTHHQKRDWSGFIIVLVVLSLFAWITISAISWTGDSNKSSREPCVTTGLIAESEPHEDYKGNMYSYLLSCSNGVYGATFEPFLPNDDSVIVVALLKLIERSYGGENKIDPTPRLTTINDKNYILLNGDGYRYLFYPFKEDTGEINTISFWRESI